MNPTKQMRLAAGLTQAECAENAGVTQPRWQQMESKARLHDMMEKTQRKIARGLGITLITLWLTHHQMLVDTEAANKESTDA